MSKAALSFVHCDSDEMFSDKHTIFIYYVHLSYTEKDHTSSNVECMKRAEDRDCSRFSVCQGSEAPLRNEAQTKIVTPLCAVIHLK